MKFLWGMAVFFLLVTGCREETKIPVPDVDHIELSYDLVRYEQLLAQLDTNDVRDSFGKLEASYPVFTGLYFNRIVPINDAPDGYSDAFYPELKNFLTDVRIRYLLDTVAQVFPDFTSTMVPDLDKAFKNLKYYFPGFVEPNVYTLISEYAYQTFIFPDAEGRDGIGIGLDLYLGRNFPYKRIDPKSPAFSDYLTRTFDRDHLVRKVTGAIIDDMMTVNLGPRMLDQMIQNGKKLYIAKRILPETPDSIIMEYSGAQMDWVRDNQEPIWAFFFKEKLFYETNMMKINKYISKSPNSPGMPEDAPGETANYMGWQIIEAYMKRFPETSLQALLELQDAQQILDDSRFKPKLKNQE